jgi:eukaryotic-like serine/threonine-protein kinase
MPNQIILTVTEGKYRGKEFVFDSRATCIMGRGDDCNIVIPDEYSTISRYHCLLDINPPNIRIRDFGSRNGTYINGRLIGKREEGQTPEEGIKLNLSEYDLEHNDTFKLGDCSLAFQVNVINHQTVAYTPPKQEGFWDFVVGLFQRANAGEANLEAIKGYTLIKQLGKGGFGEVYLARHDAREELVALKVMLPQIATRTEMVNLFLREVKNSQALRHPNLVQLKDSCFADGLFFFTMEYCSGGTIADAMTKFGGKLPLEIAIPTILQVLDGLHYAHTEKGLVHRDIKPDNIFINFTPEEQVIVKLGDYGLAKAFNLAGLSGQTMTGSAMGTPFFMPRQQVLNFKYARPDIDVWAVAASFYNMLTGQYPRDLSGNEHPMFAILQTPPVPIRERDSSIPKPLAKLIDLALIDNPELCFQSALEFQQALLNVIG